MTQTTLPGYRVVDAGSRRPDPGLRNDVAAFVGSAERGPLGVPVSVDGRQSYARVFGGPTGTVPRAVWAYVANGGEVAWVVRVGTGGTTATASLALVDPAGAVTDGPVRARLPGSVVHVAATSPGTWANGAVVRLTYRAFGPAGAPEFDVAVEVPGEPPLRRAGLPATGLAAVVAGTGLLTMTFSGPGRDPVAGPTNPGPAAIAWPPLVLHGGSEPDLDIAAIRRGIAAQADVEEVALVAVPGLATTLSAADGDDVIGLLARTCAEAQDRLAVVSAPCSDPADLAAWRERLRRAVPDPVAQRAVAAYVPFVRAVDLTGRGLDRYPPTDPVGHVCGLVARLDRERGSGWSPANALVTDAVDLAAPLPPVVQEQAAAAEVNLVRSRAGGGLELWGARTLDPGEGRFVAHRRLVHRIVRAVRRVLEPLVFDVNDELLRFSVTRSVSGVLMEAWRSGSLRGETPDQAYRVRCDETTNPPDVVDDGRVVCQVEVAPAVPMEFIRLRLTLGAEGLLEVVEQ